jgi:hypothetical protein
MFYPHLACPVPQISSQVEFEIAKEYLKLSIQNDELLYRACLSTAGQPIASNIRILSEQALREIHAYHTTLYGESCRTFRSQQDDEELKRSHYDIHYRIAENLLMFVIEKVLRLPYNAAENTQLNSSLEALKSVEAILRESPEHRKKLKSAIASLENTVPQIRSLFHPNEIRTKSVKTQKISKRVAAYKTVRSNNELLNKMNRGFPGGRQDDAVENFDVHFKIKTREILTQSLELSAKKLPYEAYMEKMQTLMEEYVALEKRGIQFKALLSRSSSSPPAEKLMIEELTDLHRFLHERYTLGSKSTLQLLENSIFMCIHTNKVEDALTRVEALKNLLPVKVARSPNFTSLRASILALNGDFEEWKRLSDEKKGRSEAIKYQQKQSHVNQIKTKQEEHQKRKEQEEAQKQGKEREKEGIAVSKKAASLQKVQRTTSDIPEGGFSAEREKYTITFPREKPKTRKLGSESALQEIISLSEQPAPPVQPPPKDYTVSKAAFVTYNKIRGNNWLFPRKDLYNLFSKLGCTIDTEQGKGDHGVIHLPLIMTIHNAEGLVAALPEFSAKKTDNIPLRPMTISNWDEKWDGRVPPYMRNSILRALEYLGATNETVHK